MEARQICVKTYEDRSAAEMSQSYLASANIRSSIAVDDCGGLLPPLGAGGAALLVDADRALEARDLLENAQITADLPACFAVTSPEKSRPSLSSPGFEPELVSAVKTEAQQIREAFLAYYREWEKNPQTPRPKLLDLSDSLLNLPRPDVEMESAFPAACRASNMLSSAVDAAASVLSAEELREIIRASRGRSSSGLLNLAVEWRDSLSFFINKSDPAAGILEMEETSSIDRRAWLYVAFASAIEKKLKAEPAKA